MEDKVFPSLMEDENIEQRSHQHKHRYDFLHKGSFTGLLGISCLVDLFSSTVNIGQQMKQPVTGPIGRWMHKLIHQCIVTEAPFLYDFEKVGLCTTGANAHEPANSEVFALFMC